jgi:hypothetical protein
MLIIKEHSSTSYGPRTYVNAASADVTIAIATDYSTAGEKCTHKAAGSKYLRLQHSAHTNIELARILYCHMKNNNCRSINVAGNGIYTLAKSGLTQESINLDVFEILATVHKHWEITKIVCGGQTGVDMAGAVAGYALGIETVVTYPKGFKMRMADKIDRDYSEEFIRNMVISYAHKLEAEDE